MRNLDIPPTFEEFLTAVKAGFKRSWYLLTDQEAERYLASEMKYIEESYRYEVKAFEAGEITCQVFMIGSVAATYHCLEMMY